jgi:D-alanyl-D-alanine carboxypeptidase
VSSGVLNEGLSAATVGGQGGRRGAAQVAGMTSSTTRTRRRLVPLLGLSVAAAVVVGACGSSSPVAQFKKEHQIDKDMDALVAKGIPGVVVAFNEGDHITTVVRGQRDLTTATPMRRDDKLRIGSITKSFTAVVVLQLAAEGRIALSDTVEQWLPGLVPGGAAITVGQLLNHTSGLAEYEVHPAYLEPYLSGDLGHVSPPEQLVAFANELGAEPVAPGTARYSNTNYTLAGLVVEAATGNPLAIEMERRIFEPLGLDDTSYPMTPDTPSPTAHGYMVMDGPGATDVTGLSPTMAGPAGAIVSTAGDVASFYRALFSGELLEPHELELMKQLLPADDGQMLGYGVKAEQRPCGTFWGHGGNFPGYLMLAWSSDDGARQGVVAINSDPRTSGDVEASIKALLTHALCGPGAVG